jgi:putative membrane protein
MSVLRHIVTAGGGLAVALMASPMIALQAQDRELNNDLPFLREAASANLMEIRLGQVAQSSTSNAAVKQYGLRMVTDHTKLEQDLTSLTSRNGIALDAALTSEQLQNITSLRHLSGQQFDQAYMTMMIQNHQADVTRFDDRSRNADSPQVREFAASSLPVLQQHLSLAQQVGGQVGVNVATTTPVPSTPVPSKIPVRTQSGQVTNPNTQAQSRAEDVRADNEFVHEVAADNLLEVRMAQLAERKGESSAVKQFAERIAADHNRLQDDWLGMASRNGQQFKAGIGKKHKAKLNRLEKLSGRALDRAYITTVVQDHRDYINYFEKEGRSAHSTQVRELVNRDLPTLRSHFNQAKRIGGQIGADTAATLRSERVSSSK